MDDLLERWLSRDPDPRTRAELQALRNAGEHTALAARFSGRLAFGTAGLRGVVGAGPNRMNRLVVRETSAGLGHYLLQSTPDAAQKGVVVGYDARPDSQVFAEDCAAVLIASGLRVFLSRQHVPTPVCAFAVRELSACCGVVITASHNPPEYNGYKVYWENGAQIIPPHDSGIARAIDAATQMDIPWCELSAAEHDGRLEWFSDPLIERYLAGVLRLSHRGPRPGRDKIVVAYTPLHGVGAALTETVLKRSGFTVHTVADQREPDGRFPTVRFPNPEEPGAMDAVLALAREVDADLVLANDPDADRLAAAVRDEDTGYRMLTGDQLGLALGLDRLSADPDPATALISSTVVSSGLLRRVAKAHGAQTLETLTGFKWIVNSALQLAERRGLRFIFGYEEALGYTIGGLVRDKDGISAALCFAELAADLASKQQTVWHYLQAVFRQHGLYVTAQRSLALAGDAHDRPSLAERLRDARPSHVAGRAVTSYSDLSLSQRYIAAEGTGSRAPTFAAERTEAVDLPPSDVLVYQLEGGARIVVRPSGTEPKVKCYYELQEPFADDEDFAAAQRRATQKLEQLVQRHQHELASV